MNQSDFEKKLASFDFSGESRVRGSLRGRLLSRGERRRALAPLALAFAAAALLIVFSPRKAPRRAYPADSLGLPVLPGAFPAQGGKAEPVFESHPGSPFETRPVTIDDIFVRRRI